MRSPTLLLVLGAIAFQGLVRAQDSTSAPPTPPKDRFSGETYLDYYYNIQMNDASKKDLQGFQFRRIYFTYDHTISPSFDARVRFEADQKELTTPSAKITTFMKEAFLKWKGVFEGSDFIAGLSPTPTWDIAEVAWGYRSLEKTIMDLRGIAPRTDLGVDLRGKLAGDGTANYWLKIGNNSGQSIETNKFKRYYGLLHFKPSSQFQATVYADLDAEAKVYDSFDGTYKDNNSFTFAGFLGYREEGKYSFGLEGFYHPTQNNFRSTPLTALETQNGYGVSAWAWGMVADQVRLVGRFDIYDSNTGLSNNTVYFGLGAIDFMPTPDVHIMPNVWIQPYAATGSTTDVVARLTFGYYYR